MELYLQPVKFNRNLLTGRFLKGSTPHNKGKKIEQYMDIKKIDKIKKFLKRTGNKNIAGWNKKKVCTFIDNKLYVFESSVDAGKKMGIQSRNIRNCCNGKRKHCGGFKWFNFDSDELINL